MPRTKLELRCRARLATRTTPTLCVSAGHNPEMAAASRNYGHFVLAFLYPLFNASSLLKRDGQPPVHLRVAHGNNVAPLYFRQKIEVLLDLLPCASARVAAEDHDHIGQHKVGDQSWQSGGGGCDEHVRVSVPFGSMEGWSTPEGSPSYWRDFKEAADRISLRVGLLRAPLPLPRAPDPTLTTAMRWRGGASASATASACPRIVVLQRRSRDDALGRRVDGLERACSREFGASVMARHGVRISCVSFNMSTSMREIGVRVGDASIGLVGVHGAGMANLLFLRPRAAFVEIDALANVKTDRRIHLLAASAIGLSPAKVWLDGRGNQHFPTTTPVRRGARGLIKGYYTASVRITEDTLAAIVANISRGRVADADARRCRAQHQINWP